ncbi:hypothetical protein EK403_17025 [Hansschlegelia zhihuaiae]|uniref:Uncharacterized protein n=1 Tax=Hansschlegelia zhihuaiae TaxID=405005 RepID=A0A4Q0MAH8_9HYPH|nr:hypothetical protein EK403_17025 [Hansschlegelia zhihuaiae]
MGALRNWVQRKQFWFDDDEDLTAPAAGLPHQIGERSLMRVAIMARLTRVDGLFAGRAWEITSAFTEFGDIGIVGLDEEVRGPGEMYKGERFTTFLVAAGHGQRPLVVKADREAGYIELVATMLEHTSAIVINLNRLHESVAAGLAAVRDKEVGRMSQTVDA